MKKIACIAIIFVSLAVNTLQAQQIKIGYVNSLELLGQMPDAKVADSTLNKLATDMQAQYNSYLQEYQKMQDEIANTPGMSEVVKEAKLQDLDNLGQRIQQYEKDSQDKLGAKKEELYKPILEKATNAVKEVAKESGYTYVFDSSTGAIVQAPDGDNIIDLVKKKLNIK